MHSEPTRGTARIAGNLPGFAQLSRPWEGAGVLFAMALAALVSAAGIIVSLHGG